jgi:hypothetical protein
MISPLHQQREAAPRFRPWDPHLLDAVCRALQPRDRRMQMRLKLARVEMAPAIPKSFQKASYPAPTTSDPGSSPRPCDRTRYVAVGGGCPSGKRQLAGTKRENARYANRETALTFVIVHWNIGSIMMRARR